MNPIDRYLYCTCRMLEYTMINKKPPAQYKLIIKANEFLLLHHSKK